MKYIIYNDRIIETCFITLDILRKGHKQADTIEELCDEFVIEYNSGHHMVWGKLENALEIAKIQKHSGIAIKNIFGAIWTNKGLIYVAKMNSKGELEFR
jgi:hypothetical protein